MKEIITALQGALLIAAFTIQPAISQQVASATNKLPNSQNAITTEVAGETPPLAMAANVSKRAIKDFVKSYHNKVQPVWSLSADNGFTASFDEAGAKNCIYYDKRGYWVCSMKRYDESGMSRELRQQVKPVYYDYKINGITEITVPGKTVYLVYLQDAHNFKTIRVADDEMDVIEWFLDDKIQKP